MAGTITMSRRPCVTIHAKTIKPPPIVRILRFNTSQEMRDTCREKSKVMPEITQLPPNLSNILINSTKILPHNPDNPRFQLVVATTKDFTKDLKVPTLLGNLKKIFPDGGIFVLNLLAVDIESIISKYSRPFDSQIFGSNIGRNIELCSSYVSDSIIKGDLNEYKEPFDPIAIKPYSLFTGTAIERSFLEGRIGALGVNIKNSLLEFRQGHTPTPILGIELKNTVLPMGRRPSDINGFMTEEKDLEEKIEGLSNERLKFIKRFIEKEEDDWEFGHRFFAEGKSTSMAAALTILGEKSGIGSITKILSDLSKDGYTPGNKVIEKFKLIAEFVTQKPLESVALNL
ncbi:MAG: hypothetical protein NT030_00985 [Candidatus Saganbacteria bacterium]|nr:hypothetical protein [Candidatus Saganbacteria bacterium]